MIYTNKIKCGGVIKNIHEHVGKKVILEIEGYIDSIDLKNDVDLINCGGKSLPIFRGKSTEIELVTTSIEIKNGGSK